MSSFSHIGAASNFLFSGIVRARKTVEGNAFGEVVRDVSVGDLLLLLLLLLLFYLGGVGSREYV